MTKLLSVRSTSAFIFLFVFSAFPVFAQHGGGGHGGGGGFHGGGGGGFHGGGGGMRSNPGFGGSGRAPAAGFGAPRSMAPSPWRSGGQLGSRPGFASQSRPGGGFGNPNQHFGNSAAPPAVADGRWHAFGGPGAGRESSGRQPQFAPANGGSEFHVATGNRQMRSPGTVRSFSGQGGEIWETTPSARNVVPRSQSLSTMQGSFRGSRSAGSTLGPNSTLSATSRFSSEPAMRGGQQFSSRSGGAGSVQQLRSFDRNGWSHERFGRGCWNCGFGFGRWGWGRGWGFGWGSPWFGFWGWNPFWVDPWWGWPSAGYGYYAPPAYNLYSSPDSTNSVPYDYSAPPAQPDEPDNSSDQGNIDGNWITPNGPSPSSSANSGALTVPVLIYLKGGGMLSVRDYWMLDGELHYLLMNGTQHSVDLEQVDLPRTNAENAKSGVKFIFKSEPSVTAPPDPDAQPGSPAAPTPKQQLNEVPAPEAHT